MSHFLGLYFRNLLRQSTSSSAWEEINYRRLSLFVRFNRVRWTETESVNFLPGTDSLLSSQHPSD